MKLTNRLKIDKDNLVGAEYYEPVFLTGEHGATFTGNSADGTTLNGAEVAKSAPASLNPSSIWFQSRASIEALGRMSEKGDKAFENYMKLLLKNTRKALDKRIEVVHNVGTTGIGVTSSVVDNGTSCDLVLTQARWAPHIWLNMTNCHLDIYDGATKLNQLADLVVTSVDLDTRTVTCSGNATDINDIASAAGGSTLYYLGMKGNTGPGLRDIALLNGADVLYGITSSTYPDVWRASQVTWDVSTDPEFTWSLLQSGIKKAVSRGLSRDLIAQVPFNVWTSLNSSLDALRVFDKSFSVSSVEMGHEEDAITYRSLGIKVTIEPSGYQPEGEVICYPNPTMGEDSFKLVAAQPITFDMPGTGKEMVYQVEGTTFCEWCAYTNQTVFTTAPRDFIYFGTDT